MYKIKCKNCEKIFITSNKRRETCSQSCRTAFHYRKKFGDKVLNIENTSILVQHWNKGKIHSISSFEPNKNTSIKYNVFKRKNTFKKYNENRYIIIETVERFNTQIIYKYFFERINKKILFDININEQNIIYHSLPDSFTDKGLLYNKMGYIKREYYYYWENLKDIAVQDYFVCAAQHSYEGEILVLYITSDAVNRVLSKNAEYLIELPY